MRYALVLVMLCSGCFVDRQCECAAPGPNVLVRVVDATTQAVIAAPAFALDGADVSAYCQDTVDAGPCTAWGLLAAGPHELAVTAPGYAPMTIQFDARVTQTSCCPAYEEVDETVALTPSP